ncbi:MAG: SDR family oxidoreductase [Syntrophomonadaceae bacterium]|nr:SDR family oxidoreductase [Syntrophomonadaceae bacterium]
MTERKEPEVEGLRKSADRLKDRVVIITGSTSGIGKASAILFAWEGAKVVVVGRRAEKGQAVVGTIKANGGEAIFVQTDITDDDQCKNLVETTLKTYGRIDVLFNNAGCLITGPFTELTKKDWDDFISLDAYSMFRMMQLVLPVMEKQGGGVILNDTSLAALDSKIPGGAIYGFVKAGVNHMSQLVAAEYVAKNIRVNNIQPGLIATEMTLTGAGADGFDYMASMMPMGRPGTALEVAYGALFLCCDESSYITGCSLLIDGGVRGN